MKKANRWAGVALIIIGVANGSVTAEEAVMGTSNGERVEAISLIFKSYCGVKDEERVAEIVKFLENLRISSYAFPNAEAEKGFYRDIANKRLWLWRKIKLGLTPAETARVEKRLADFEPYDGDNGKLIERAAAGCAIHDRSILISEVVAGMAEESKPEAKTVKLPPLSEVMILDKASTAGEFEAFVKKLAMVPGTQVNGESPLGQYTTYEAVDANGVKYRIRVEGKRMTVSGTPGK
jgi:hypothetical protein